MESSGGAMGKFVAMVVALLLAVGVMAAWKFNFFELRTLIEGNERKLPPRPPSGANTPGDNPGRGVEIRPEPFDTTPPGEKPWKVYPDLARSVVITRSVGDYRVRFEMVLVEGGWFIEGEDDGTESNMPMHWTALDPYYIKRTEMTNEEIFTFVLDDGYRREQFWNPDGFSWVSEYRKRGPG